MQLEVIGINDSPCRTRPNAQKVVLGPVLGPVLGLVLGPCFWCFRLLVVSQNRSGTGPVLGPVLCDRWYRVPLQTAVMPPQTAPDTFPDWHPCRTLDRVPGPGHSLRGAPTALFLEPCGYWRTSCHLSDFSVNPCGRGSLDLFCKRVQYVESNRARLKPACPGPCQEGQFQGDPGRGDCSRANSK